MPYFPRIKYLIATVTLLISISGYSQLLPTYDDPSQNGTALNELTIPAGVTKATVQAWGAGGNGGGAFIGNVGGGGGGAYSKLTLTGLLGDYDIEIGSGSDTNVTNKISEFKPSAGTALVSANGGALGGDGFFSTGAGGAGGTGGIGVITSGGNGVRGGGSSAGILVNGNDAIGTTGGVAVSGGGAGGDAPGAPGVSPGGGGGGANGIGAGGAGGNGQVIVCLWPAAPGSITGTSTVCQGDTNVAYSILAISNATSYEWSYAGSGIIINGTGSSVTLDFADNSTSENLTVRGINECGQGEWSTTFPITVNPKPTAGFTYSDTYLDVSFTNTSTGGTSYAWDFGDGNFSSTTDPSHSYSIAGDYDVTLITTGPSGCTDEITQLVSVADDPLGIDDEILSAFSLYPNPVSSGKIKITMPNEIDEFSITVSSILGQELFSNKLQNSYNKIHAVDVQNLKSGIYFISVSTENGNATKKLIIDNLY